MRYLMTVLTVAILAALSLAPTPAVADESDGYTERDGFWWKDGVPYTRSKVESGEWVQIDCCNRVWRPTVRYSYRKYLDPKAPDFWERLADAVKIDRAAEARQRELNARLDALELFGYQKKAAPAATPAGLTYGAAGPTIYGYSYQQYADLYGTTDLNALYQQAARLAENSQAYSERATSGHTALVKEAADGAARVAEIRAKGEAAAAFLKSLPTPQAKIETKIQGVEPPKEPRLGAILPDKDFLITANKYGCVKCHSGNSLGGGYDVTKHWDLSAEKRLKVVERLLLPKEADGHMPKNGDSLPAADVLKFLNR